jgi:hypothetical protein
MDEIKLKYTPAFFSLISSTLLIAGGISILCIDYHNWIASLIPFLIGAFQFFASIFSFKKTITISCEGTNVTIYEKNWLEKTQHSININSIERIWVYKSSINFIPTTSRFECLIYNNKKKFNLLEIYGSDGYLPTEYRELFIRFMAYHNPNIKFGYEKYIDKNSPICIYCNEYFSPGVYCKKSPTKLHYMKVDNLNCVYCVNNPNRVIKNCLESPDNMHHLTYPDQAS